MKPMIKSIIVSFLIAILCLHASDPEEITIMRDSLPLKGKFYTVVGSGYYPTVLLLQGFTGNENDVLGIGEKLEATGFNAVTFNYSGTYKSDGEFSWDNTLKDIQAVLNYLHQPEIIHKFHIDTTNIFLGGYCYGGGMALSYAIKHPEINRVFSIAGTDHGEFLIDYANNPDMRKIIDNWFGDLKKKPEVVRFEDNNTPNEYAEMKYHEQNPIYHLIKNADVLAKDNILLICGWDDKNISIERFMLPLYRAIIKAGGQNLVIKAFQDDHAFKNSRYEIAEAIIDWINFNIISEQ